MVVEILGDFVYLWEKGKDCLFQPDFGCITQDLSGHCGFIQNNPLSSEVTAMKESDFIISDNS